MKKILVFLLLLFAFVLTQAQERTVLLNSGKELDLNTTKWYAYNGNTADRLIPTTRDTIDYIIQVKNQGSGPLHFYAAITLDTIAGIDTTVAITVQQKKFSGENYSDVIASDLTSVVSAEVLIVKTSLGITSEFTETQTIAAHNITGAAYKILADTLGSAALVSDTIRVPATTYTEAAQSVTVSKLVNTLLYPRYIKLRLILTGNDSVGTGVKVKRIEFQFYN